MRSRVFWRRFEIHLRKVKSQFIEASRGDLRTLFFDAAVVKSADEKSCIMVLRTPGVQAIEVAVSRGDTLAKVFETAKIEWSGFPQLRIIKNDAILQSSLLYPKVQEVLSIEVVPGDVVVFTIQE